MREPLCQKPIISIMLGMETGVKSKRIDISNEGVQKILAEPWLPLLIELKCGEKVLLGLV